MRVILKFVPVSVAALIAATVHAQDSTNSTASVTTATLTAPASNNNTTSRKTTRAENHRFSSAVQHAIYASRDVGDADILAFGNAATGTVVLVGYVFDPKQEQAALDAARQVAGVTDVTSQLMMQEHGE